MLIVIYVALVFLAWMGWAWLGHKRDWSKLTVFGSGFFIALIVPIIPLGLGVGFLDKDQAKSSVVAESKATDKEEVWHRFMAAIQGRPDPRSISNLEEAGRYVIGTWTHVDPVTDSMSVFRWEKWVIKPNGVLEQYSADPQDDNWGQPEMRKYAMFTGKYTDTGERFYGFKILDTAMIGIIQPDGNLRFDILRNGSVEMVRGDRFPFSK